MLNCFLSRRRQRVAPLWQGSLLGQTGFFFFFHFGLFVFLRTANPRGNTQCVPKVTCDEKTKSGHSWSSFIMFTHCGLSYFQTVPGKQPWDGGVSELTAAATQDRFSSTIPSIARLSLFDLPSEVSWVEWNSLSRDYLKKVGLQFFCFFSLALHTSPGSNEVIWHIHSRFTIKSSLVHCQTWFSSYFMIWLCFDLYVNLLACVCVCVHICVPVLH